MSAVPIRLEDVPRRKGFAPIDNEYLWDWSRLLSGDAQVFSILLINSEIHTLRKKGEPPAKWTKVITSEELSQFARCTVRAIEIAIGDLVARKVIERKKTAKGYVYHIPFSSWPALPDRPSKVVTLEEASEEAEQETDDQAQAPKTAVPVVANWQKVRARGRTKPVVFPEKAVPGKLRIRTEDGIEYRSFIVNGTLDVEIRSEQEAKGEQKATRNQFRVQEPQVQSNQHRNFHLYETAWLNHGINAAPGDWTESRSAWASLDTPQQLAAVKGVNDRFEQGEYDDPKFIPLPQNYLRKSLWMRPVRPRKAVGKPKVFRDEQGARDFMSHIRSLGSKK